MASVTTLEQQTEPLTPFQEWLASREIDPTHEDYSVDADVDGDGATTYEEYLADTDPANGDSVLALTGMYVPKAQAGGDTGEMRFTFPASTGRFYQLAYSTGLTNPAVSTQHLGRGVSGMVVTNRTTGTWYGVIRALLEDPDVP